MQIPKIDVKPTQLATLLNEMKNGRLQVPRFRARLRVAVDKDPQAA